MLQTNLHQTPPQWASLGAEPGTSNTTEPILLIFSHPFLIPCPYFLFSIYFDRNYIS